MCAITKTDGVTDFMCDLQSEGDRKCENETDKGRDLRHPLKTSQEICVVVKIREEICQGIHAL